VNYGASPSLGGQNRALMFMFKVRGKTGIDREKRKSDEKKWGNPKLFQTTSMVED